MNSKLFGTNEKITWNYIVCYFMFRLNLRQAGSTRDLYSSLVQWSLLWQDKPRVHPSNIEQTLWRIFWVEPHVAYAVDHWLHGSTSHSQSFAKTKLNCRKSNISILINSKCSTPDFIMSVWVKIKYSIILSIVQITLFVNAHILNNDHVLFLDSDIFLHTI